MYVGLVYSVLTYVGLPWSGASLNPARSLGAAVIAGDFEHHWVCHGDQLGRDTS
eukprot:m.115466 g.115466  ORF g.115466 m.115466 type:complete len:54 (+) comp15494_c0_seq1:197-358(+)